MTDKRFKLPIPIKDMAPEQFRRHRNDYQRLRRASLPKAIRVKRSYEQTRELDRARKRAAYRLKHPKIEKPKVPIEVKREIRRNAYRKRMDEKQILESKKNANKKYYVKKRSSSGLTYRSKEEIKAKRISNPKPERVVKEMKPKVMKVKAVKAVAVKPVRAPKPKPVPKPRPLRKATRPREPKTKPEVIPTLVRDESQYVSVRIDARTVIRVPPGKDIEQVKQRYIARMLQNSKI